ncbi:hypothetical protein SBI_09326 [Streptomyces bingchenggensis BCW-1]|uniref:HTH hxlR-type domain-containing protein n=2 Tax=Streptomyces TaxID=1883 RepID=D7C5R5_STRBB|nr:hypothetical protein SBI_09326 [Streptomyces bingchenggensis BCW-1]
MLVSLREGYSELQRSLGAISRKMLSQTLRTMERDGLVLRSVDPRSSPPLVPYSLTEPGRELAEETRTLCPWTEKRTAMVQEAHATDARTPTRRPETTTAPKPATGPARVAAGSR